MTNFSFTTKDTYLTYRAAWKQEYAALSIAIRSTKAEIRQQNRALGRTTPATNSALAKAVRHANEMLAELVKAKIEAGKQYKEKSYA